MKESVSKQVIQKERKDRREGRGRVLAISRNVYKLSGKSTYYVESETCDNRYYFIRYNPSIFELCSCKDFESNRTERCKHIYGVEFSIRFNSLQEVDQLPQEIRGGKKSTDQSPSFYHSFIFLL